MSNRPAEAKKRVLLGLVGLYLVHLLLAAYVFPPHVVFAGLPLGGGDYQTHYHQTYRLAEALRSTGRAWGYEPQFLAGQPAGIIFDVDNKAHFLFSYGLSRLGMHLADAFNLFAVLSTLAAPLCLLLAARLLGIDGRGQLAVLGLGIATFYLDTAPRFFLTAGMVSFLTATYLSLLGLVLFWRLLGSPGRPGLRLFLGLLALYPLAHLVHAWAFVILVGPSLILYGRAFRRLPWSGHLQVLGVATAVLAVNAFWLCPSLAHADLMTASEKIGQSSPLTFLHDLLELVPFMPPVTLQTTLFRHLALAAAVVVVYRWTRAADERGTLALILLGWFFFLSYVSARLPLFRLTEPYRFVLALGLAAVVLSGPLLGELLSAAVWREQLAGPFRSLAALGLVVLLPQLGHQVLASAPELIPRPEPLVPQHDPPPWQRLDPPPMEITLRQQNVSPDYLAVARHLERHCPEPGRILVEPWELAEFLGWASERHVIGGFPERRLVMESANLFRDEAKISRLREGELADYLVRYNVRYLIIHLPIFPMVEQRRDLLESVAKVGPYRIFRTRHRGDYFLRGAGKVTTSLNRIQLTDVSPDRGTGDVAIRFHYMRGLRCRPGCRLVREPIPGSRASFIGIVGEPGLASTITLEHQP